MKLHKRICFTLFLFPLVFVAIGLMFSLVGILGYGQQNRAEEVTAVVTACKRDFSTDADIHSSYRIYVAYTYEGVEYKDVFYGTEEKYRAPGESFPIRISQNRPEKPITTAPLTMLLIGVPLVAVGVVLGIRMMPAAILPPPPKGRKKKAPKGGRKQLLWGLLPGAAMVAFLILGIAGSFLFHIGTIVFAYLTVFTLENLSR